MQLSIFFFFFSLRVELFGNEGRLIDTDCTDSEGNLGGIGSVEGGEGSRGEESVIEVDE